MEDKETRTDLFSATCAAGHVSEWSPCSGRGSSGVRSSGDGSSGVRASGVRVPMSFPQALCPCSSRARTQARCPGPGALLVSPFCVSPSSSGFAPCFPAAAPPSGETGATASSRHSRRPARSPRSAASVGADGGPGGFLAGRMGAEASWGVVRVEGRAPGSWCRENRAHTGLLCPRACPAPPVLSPEDSVCVGDRVSCGGCFDV